MPSIETTTPRRPPAGARTTATTAWLATASELAEEFASTAVEREREDIPPVAQLQQLRDSGLVNLLIPSEFGGEGGSLRDAVEVTAAISRGDASIGAILGFHYYVSAVPKLFDFRDDAEELQRRSAEERWLWANVHRPQEKGLSAAPDGDGGFVLNGSKRWSTGGPLADVTTVIGNRTDRKELLFSVIPTDRAGLSYRDDWDNLGLRLTATVTADFADVEVRPDEVIRSTHRDSVVTFPPLYTSFVMPLYGAVFVGATWAALERSREYVLGREKPRLRSGQGHAPKDDPTTLGLFGYSVARLKTAEAFVNRVATEVQHAYDRRLTISGGDLAAVATRAAAARGVAAEVALDVTPRVYDLTGTSATANTWGLDRHWRDVRTLSLHDSIAVTRIGIGDFVLNGVTRPMPPFVS